MNEFTASNGVRVECSDDGRVLFVVAERPTSPIWFRPGEFTALREFFRAEEDERLGRWRWPENPDVTVRTAPAHAQRAASGKGTVMIQKDSDGYVGYYDRDSLPAITHRTGGIVRAGHAYFDAHPEPKPWHDAKPDEVWVLTYGGRPTAHVYTDRMAGRFQFISDRAIVDPDDPDITAGRRIWPEQS